jgi:D-sedoheptulose 7-phosphate isomerase
MNNIDKFFTPQPAEFARSYLDYLKTVLDKIDIDEIECFISEILAARSRGATIYFIGNGGSASTASHFANDLAIGTNDYDQPFRVISLTDNVSILTALGNDFGYEEIFERQLRVLGLEGDILVSISASGNSPNLIRAMEYAKSSNIKTVAITAFDGGKMKDIADMGIHIPTGFKEYGPAEDCHMILDHLVGSYLKKLVQIAK